MSTSTSKLHDIKKILVPIDFSELTMIALGQAVNFAKVIDAEITLINVSEDYGVFNKYISDKDEKQMKARVEEQLQKIANEYSAKSKLTINTLTAKGKIYAKIVEVAEMINASFIIMGTSGKLGLMKFIGSNTLRVIRESKIPVISMLGNTQPQGCKNIILPLDLSKETREKVSKALWLARMYAGAKVRVVTVITTSDKYLVSRLKKQMEQVKNFIAMKGIECTVDKIKQTGSKKTIARSIIDYANKVNGDVILIMTQQETNFTNMFIGSAAQEIINNSNIPVMSIIPVPRKFAAIV